VRALPDDLPAYAAPAPVVDEVYHEIINIGRHNVPMIDYHVYLRNGMTIDDALRKSRKDGIQYGITADASMLKTDSDAARWLHPFMGLPVFFALSTANSEWTRSLSQKTARQFDYILADGRTWVEAQAPTNRDAFMERLVNQTVKRLDTEPIDIYSHLTYLPLAMRAHAGELWTEDRTTKLIDALVRNKTAIELETLDRTPTQSFIQQAKDAGCKFGFGTANGSATELKRCEYGLEMVETCKLDWHNFFAPGAWCPVAAERRWPASV
jgi:hypothetical protein